MTYLTAGVGPRQSANLDKLADVNPLIGQLSTAWVCVADWTMSAQELESTSIMGDLGPRPVTPRGAQFTCTSGDGSVLDECVASEGAFHLS